MSDDNTPLPPADLEKAGKSRKKASARPKKPRSRDNKGSRDNKHRRLKVKNRQSRLVKTSRKGRLAKAFKLLAINFSFIIVSIAQFFSYIWQAATRIDQALWRMFKSGLKATFKGIGVFADWIIEGIKDFIFWLPTKKGQAYCAFTGAVTIIAGLWIADELRAVERTLQAAEAKTASTTSPPITALNSSKDPIIARILGEYIYLSEVEKAAISAGTLAPEKTLTLGSERTTQFINDYIDQRVLAMAAQEEQLTKDEALTTKLNLAQDRILAAAYLDKKLEEAVTEEKVFTLYKAQSDIAQLGQEIKAYHILVETRADAVDIVSALERGVDFSTLARSRSLDRGTAPYGGETGYLTTSMVSEEFGRIAFSYDKGQTSPPFRTSEGWNIVKIIDKRETQTIPYKDVKDNLRQFLTLRTIDNTIQSLRQDFEIVMYDQVIEGNDSRENDDKDNTTNKNDRSEQ